MPKRSASSKPKKRDQSVKLSNTEWNEETNKWEQAKKALGLIEEKGEFSFEVWRGSTKLPGYISCIEGKHKIIDRIGGHLKRFAISGTPVTLHMKMEISQVSSLLHAAADLRHGYLTRTHCLLTLSALFIHPFRTAH